MVSGKNHEVSRRRLLGALGAWTLVGLPLRAAAQDATPAASPGAGWTFTDDAGVTITFPETPQRVVAYVNLAAALDDFGAKPVGYFGQPLRADGTRVTIAGDMDLVGMISVAPDSSTCPERSTSPRFRKAKRGLGVSDRSQGMKPSRMTAASGV